MANRLLRLPNVIALTGLPRSSIYRYMEEGDFPRAVKLSERSVAWIETELEEWIALKIAESRPSDPSNASG